MQGRQSAYLCLPCPRARRVAPLPWPTRLRRPARARAGLLPVLLLVTVVPALAALAAGLVLLLWRRRARVAASDAFLGKLAASVLDGGGGGASPRAGRGRSLRAPRGSLADSLASEARRARALWAATVLCPRDHPLCATGLRAPRLPSGAGGG